MNNYKNTILKGAKHCIYSMLIQMINLSEYIYNKLKFIKRNYKGVFINIFEETDQNISIENSDNYSKYIIIEPILFWLSSLFGVIDRKGEVVTITGDNKNYHINQLEIVDMLFRNLNTYLLIIIVGLLFMIYYFFT